MCMIRKLKVERAVGMVLAHDMTPTCLESSNSVGFIPHFPLLVNNAG